MLDEAKLPPMDALASYRVGREPLPVRLHLLAGVHGRQRRRDPARLQRVGRVGAAADQVQAEFLARLEDRVANQIVLGIRSEQLVPGLASHAVPQGAHSLAGDGDVAHVEELELRRLAADHLLQHLHRVRALKLEAIRLAVERVGPRRRTLVERDLHVVAAGGRVELDPVEHRDAAHEIELVFSEVEQDHVADHVAVVAAGDELLGLVDGEVGEAVDAQPCEQLHGVRSFNSQVGHVVRLVEEHAGLLPRLHLVPPVGVFGRYAGIHVRSRLLISQQRDRVACRLDDVLETPLAHSLSIEKTILIVSRPFRPSTAGGLQPRRASRGPSSPTPPAACSPR